MTVFDASVRFNASGVLDVEWAGAKESMLRGWIDYFFKFNDEADAIADAVKYKRLGRYDNSSPPVWSWDRDYVIPDIKAWRPSQDGGSPPAHNYLNGWFCIVAWEKPAQLLMMHPNLQFALNRFWNKDWAASSPPAPKNLVVKNNIGAIINDVAVSNVFAGSDYPVGGF